MSLVFPSIEITNLLHGTGINIRAPVRVATTINGALATAFENGDTLDGVLLATGDRILLKDQSTATENGPYTVNATGAPSRIEDLGTGESANLVSFWVKEGSANASTAWVCTSVSGSDIVGTHALTFVRYDVKDTLSIARGGTNLTTIGGTNTLLYTTTADNIANITTGNNGVLVTDGSGVPSISSTLPSNISATSATLTTPVISGNMTFDEATNDLTLAILDQTTGVATLTIPDLGGTNGNMVVTNLTQTLTNKTLTAPVISSISNTGTITLPTSTDTLVGRATTDTLTNKTLTAPIISTISNTGTLTLPTITDTLIGRTTTDTLTNKTLTVPIISTISNTGTITLPTNTDTLIGRTTTDTLTNKTWGDDLNMNNNKIVNLATPTEGGDVANKSYVDNVASGLDTKSSVVVATINDLDSNSSISGVITYNSTAGASSRGQITATLSVSDTFTVDGVNFGTAQDGARILLKDQTTGAQNGIWITTVSGTSLTLDRATDFDEDAEVTAGAYTWIEEGTTNADSGWTLTTNNPITIGGASGTALTFTQFSGSGQITGGDGLDKNGNTLSVDLKANGGIVIDSTEMAIDLGASNITGTLSVGDGGIGLTTFGGTNTILYTTGTDALASITAGANGVLVTNGSNVPSISSTLPSGLSATNTVLTTPTISGNIIFDETTNDLTLAITDQTVSAPTLTIPNLAGTNGDVVINNATQTLTNKTLTAPIISTISNTGTITLPTSTDTLVGRDTTDTLTNKTLTAPIISTISNTGILTLPTSTDTLVGLATTDTLTNKTLTTPIISTAINDTNGNELISVTATASAVNEFTIANAATGNGPTISVTGNDANVDLNLQIKGTGTYRFLSTSTTGAELRLFEDTDAGGNYIGLRAGALTSNLTLTLPISDGNSGNMLVTNGSGALSFVSPPVPKVVYQIANQQIDVNTTVYTTLGYMCWDDSSYSGYTNGSLTYEVDITDRNLDIRIRDITNNVTIVEETGVSTDGFRKVTAGFTNPTTNGRLALQVRKSATGGTSPQIYGVQLEWTP